MEVKQPTTFKQQVEIIAQKGVIIADEEFCFDFLNCVNYYRFSAYLLPFRKSDMTYSEGTEFERACLIYEFDAKMRNLLFKVIEEIEMHLRTQLSYYHAQSYGPLGYKYEANFNEKHKHDHFHKLLEDIVRKNRTCLVVKHHLKKYDGQFPIWVIIEFFSIGMVSYFYSDLKLADKKKIASDLYDTIPANVDSWLRCITDLRNLCAHYSRLYYWIFSAAPAIPRSLDYVMNRRLFDQLLVLKFLYPKVNDWNKALAFPLESLIGEYEKYIELHHIGFPVEWKEILRSKY